MGTPPSTGHLTADQVDSFVSLLLIPSPIMRVARFARIPGTDDRDIADMRAPHMIAGRYIRALSSLAGVKVRKARVFLGLDRGYLTATARHRITEALKRAALSGKAE